MKQTKSIAAKNILSKASVASLVSGHTTILQATLWGRNVAAHENSPEYAYSPSPAAQMLCDLVLASDGELLSSSGSAISASYKSARQAIIAVRHMQQLVKGFSEVAAAGPLYSSFTLQYADRAADSSDADLSLVPSSRSESESVVLIGDICADAQSIPGLRFKESTSTAQKKRGKVIELLSSSRAPEPQAVAPRIELAPVAKVPSPVTRFKAVPVQRQTTSPSGLRPATPARVPPSAKADAFAETPLSLPRAKAIFSNVFRSRLVVGSIIGLAVMLAVGVTVKHFTGSEPQVQPPPSTNQPFHPVSTPTVVDSAAAKTTPAAPVATAPLAVAERPSSTSNSRVNPVTASPPKARPAPREHVIEQPEVASLKYTQSDIEQMIGRADKASGDGKYDQAITIYNMILKQDGRNSAALSGRDRAIRNKRQQ